MGNYSYLRRMLNNPAACHINWDIMDKIVFSHWIFTSIFKENPDERPQTLEDMANKWHNTKFYGYLDHNYIADIKDFCRCLKPCGSFPRLYFEYEGFDLLVCLEFHPGTTNVLMSTCNFGDELDKDLPPPPWNVNDNYTSVDEDEWYDLYNEAKERVWDRVIPTEIWNFTPL